MLQQCNSEDRALGVGMVRVCGEGAGAGAGAGARGVNIRPNN